MKLNGSIRETPCECGMTRHGQGASVLMLPTLSSISTRMEMWPLQERLGPWFTTLAIDWAGFGDRPRPPLRWSPEIYRSFLAYLLTEVAPRPFATIAAGHAAPYCLNAAAMRRGSTGRLCLIAPIWRGPLPTMMGRKHPMFVKICRTDAMASGERWWNSPFFHFCGSNVFRPS